MYLPRTYLDLGHVPSATVAPRSVPPGMDPHAVERLEIRCGSMICIDVEPPLDHPRIVKRQPIAPPCLQGIHAQRVRTRALAKVTRLDLLPGNGRDRKGEAGCRPSWPGRNLVKGQGQLRKEAKGPSLNPMLVGDPIFRPGWWEIGGGPQMAAWGSAFGPPKCWGAPNGLVS